MPHVMLRSPPEVDDEVSKMVISQHFIRLRVCEFIPPRVSRTRHSGFRRNPVKLFSIIALNLDRIGPLGSGFRRRDEVGTYLFTASEADDKGSKVPMRKPHTRLR